MGWKQGDGIGHTFKQDVKPLEHQVRPKGLGLGADRSVVQDLVDPVPKRVLKPGEERKEEQPTGLAVGSLIQICKAPHQDMYGKIEGLDPDNARLVARLAVGGQVVTVSQFSVRFVDPAEYKRYSKDLSRLSEAHRERQRKEEQALERQAQDRSRERRSEAGQEERERREPHSRKRKHRGGQD
ncbi:G-patch domain and KOW motifs-containing protein-like, partial [Chiloscyllium punctatum]|uniref:G-patch domain and KOW motifs-containing protein-like n=1 Tax=Chiloscyllium punctatum TaxID=137246 RepID=UPI003B632A1C